jgi:hypothetical protein
MKVKKLIYQLTSDTNIIDSDKDSTVELVENMINQKVIEELELIVKEINSFTATNRIEKRLLKTIKELKQ